MFRAKKFLGIKMHPLYKFLKSVVISDEDNILERIDSLNFYAYYFSLSFNMSFQLIKSSIFTYLNQNYNYSIKKDTLTDTVFLTFDKIMVFYISKDDIEEFSLNYMYSSFYKFVIYEYRRGYMAVCLSHTTDDINGSLLRFYLINNSNPLYIMLSHFVYEESESEESVDEEGESEESVDEESVDEESNNKDYEDDNLLFDNTLVTNCNPKSFIILNKNVQSYLDEDGSYNLDLYKLYDIIGYGEQNPAIYHFIKMVFLYIKCYKTYPINYLCI
jgi:hypothetical protein